MLDTTSEEHLGFEALGGGVACLPITHLRAFMIKPLLSSVDHVLAPVAILVFLSYPRKQLECPAKVLKVPSEA